MLSDFETLRQRALELAKDSTIGPLVTDVRLEQAEYEDGDPYLRVIVQMKDLDAAEISVLSTLWDTITTALIELDERFPSVRFADAA